MTPPASTAPTSGITQTSWLGTEPQIAFPSLETDTETDVVVIGAGIAGLSTAYMLAKEGKRVIVLDDGPIASGETGRTTAHLSNALDDRYHYLEKLFGTEGAHTAWQAHTAAIDRIEKICQEEGIDCDFRRLDGHLFVGEGCPPQELQQELEAATRAGFQGLQIMPESGQTGVHWAGPCLVFPNQAQFHPIKYINGLAKAIISMGGLIYANTHVETVHGGEGSHVHLSNGKKVRASHIVVATNTPFNDLVVMHTKQAPYRSYVVALEVPKGAIAMGLYWDTADPYYYVRLHETGSDKDLLIVGGRDHKTGQDDEPGQQFDKLESWARSHFAGLGKVAYTWSGQVMEPSDSLGYAGRNPADSDNVYIITGDSGHGMTNGMLGGILIADLIAGRSNPWADLFSPSRVTLKPDALKEFAAENLNVAKEYTELLTGGDVADTNAIQPGTGAVLRRGLSKVAAYRAPDGSLHECSAICPHLGCVVAWNNTEKSWDCPCHGSRFDSMGALLAGPANTSLAQV